MKRTPLTRKTPLRSKSPSSVPRAPVEAKKSVAGPTGQTKKRKSLRASKKVRSREPGEDAWKVRKAGRCQVCGTGGLVVNHHIIYEQHVRRAATGEQVAAGIVWDLRNALLVGAPTPWGGRCRCHDSHHSYGLTDSRIPLARIPQEAYAFASELLGPERAEDYLKSHYKPE